VSVRSERGITSAKPAQEMREKAESCSGWYEWLARIGLVAKGVSYGILGILAIDVALGGRGKTTSRTGALAELAQHPLGKVLLAVLALGFACYALWRIVQAFAERADDPDAEGQAKKWATRAGYLARAAVYAGLAYASVKILVGSQVEESQNQEARRHTAEALSWPAGRWLVAAAGLAIIGAGLWNLYRAVTRKFEEEWRVGMGRTAKTCGAWIGIVGHIARGVVFALIGLFITKAAIDYDPKEAIGLDGALQKLAEQTYGSWLLGITAAGLIAYGLYGLFDAWYRDVSVTRTSSARVSPRS
jgi:hypothetical protein